MVQLLRPEVEAFLLLQLALLLRFGFGGLFGLPLVLQDNRGGFSLQVEVFFSLSWQRLSDDRFFLCLGLGGNLLADGYLFPWLKCDMRAFIQDLDIFGCRCWDLLFFCNVSDFNSYLFFIFIGARLLFAFW